MATVTTGIGRNGVAWQRSVSKGGMSTWKLAGIETVMANLNKELAKIEAKSMAGMLVAASDILNDADKTPPLVPVDLTPLREAKFHVPRKGGKATGPYVLFGYLQNYAAAVHEMMQSPQGKPINWSRPGSGPKWFEASIKRNTKKTLETIRTTINTGI